MTTALKLVRPSEIEAFEGLGWCRKGNASPVGGAFMLVEWHGDGEPVLPQFWPIKPMRRGRIHPARSA